MKKVYQNINLERNDIVRCNNCGVRYVHTKSIVIKFQTEIMLEPGDLVETIEEKLLWASQRFGNNL
jgi:hypothetical protein